jgi:hypothetical protein
MKSAHTKGRFSSIIQLRISPRMEQALIRLSNAREESMAHIMRTAIAEYTGRFDTDDFRPAA